LPLDFPQDPRIVGISAQEKQRVVIEDELLRPGQWSSAERAEKPEFRRGAPARPVVLGLELAQSPEQRPDVASAPGAFVVSISLGGHRDSHPPVPPTSGFFARAADHYHCCSDRMRGDVEAVGALPAPDRPMERTRPPPGPATRMPANTARMIDLVLVARGKPVGG
jgi:hypothetical protein